MSKYNVLQIESPPTPSVISIESCWFPANLIEICTFIQAQKHRKMSTPEFIFEHTLKAASHNWSVLSKYNVDLGQALTAQSGTQLDYGSEFKSHSLLELIFQHHPLWTRLQSQLIKGVSFPLEPQSDESKRQDTIEALEFGNHRGAKDHPGLLKQMMTKDVEAGYSLILPLDKILKIKGALMSPMNIVEQATINEKGNMIMKKRLTHNQSMEYGSGTSLNSRTKIDELQDAMYGSCLLRVIHQIVHLRLKYPANRILIQKIDYKSAYRRGHLNADTAIQTITQHTELNTAYVALRMTFGGRPNPNFWGDISEPITDLANALLKSDDWDPSILRSPVQHLVPPTIANNEHKPFAKALPLAVDLPNDDIKADVYIDDTTTITVDIKDNEKKGRAAVLLAMAIVGRNYDAFDPIFRPELVSLAKLAAEGAMEESKVLLGWRLDTRELTISLTDDKLKAWSDDINIILSNGCSCFDELETLIGRLGHMAAVLPYSRHFMSRIRSLMWTAKNRRQIKLNDNVKDDLEFHKQFLKIANSGINLNLLTYRKITHAYRGDACPKGIGGYSATGRGWRWEIPEMLRYRATLNMLEHIAAIIGPWIDIIEGNLPPLSCILSMTDSTTAEGWLRKSNFKCSDDESEEMTKAKIDISRDHALRLLKHNCKDYSQWFPGEENDVSDSLSRDFHLSPPELTHLYHTLIPKQTPQNFTISQLPPEIESFLFSMLRSLPGETQQLERHMTSKLSRGAAGRVSSEASASGTTSSYQNFQKDNKPSSCPLSPKQLGQENFLETIIHPFTARQSKPPWATFQRPSETMTNSTHDLMPTQRLAAFYSSSTKAIKKEIQMNRIKKQFQ